MTVKVIPLSESVSSSFQVLQSSAATLNAVSDELGKAVAQIDDGLKKLNLGVIVWVILSNGDDRHLGGSSYWGEALGYAKVNGKWGICLRKFEGADYREDDDEEVWSFSDAPRQMRLDAIDKIPELLLKLSEAAAKTAKQIESRLSDVRIVANAVNPPAVNSSSVASFAMRQTK